MTRLRKLLFLVAITALSVGMPARSLKADPSSGFVLCSCQLCSRSDVICRISPSGFSIPCADYYQMHCLG
jgi:hypothetical protein